MRSYWRKPAARSVKSRYGMPCEWSTTETNHRPYFSQSDVYFNKLFGEVLIWIYHNGMRQRSFWVCIIKKYDIERIYFHPSHHYQDLLLLHHLPTRLNRPSRHHDLHPQRSGVCAGNHFSIHAGHRSVQPPLCRIIRYLSRGHEKFWENWSNVIDSSIVTVLLLLLFIETLFEPQRDFEELSTVVLFLRYGMQVYRLSRLLRQ